MGKTRASPSTSSSSDDDRRQWERIFKTLVEMLQSQESQIETLADELKYLEKYIHLQHDHWSSKTRFLESHIAQVPPKTLTLDFEIPLDWYEISM